MKKVCAWCNKILEDDQSVHLITVSHGICEECFTSLSSKIKNDLQRRNVEPLIRKLNSETGI